MIPCSPLYLTLLPVDPPVVRGATPARLCPTSRPPTDPAHLPDPIYKVPSEAVGPNWLPLELPWR